LIKLEHVTKVFGDGPTAVRAVDDLSMSVPEGVFWTLMGPSGSGKSTVLHLVAGLTSPTSGKVIVDGIDIATFDSTQAAALRRRKIGYVLQTFNLLPFLSAAENVGMPLVLDGVKQSEVDARVADALELVDISRRASHKPSALSGGEQQRIAVARALVIRPSIILADEPTGNLDEAGGRSVMELIQGVNAQTNVTVLLVTHDPVFAAFGQRVMRVVDGKLYQDIDINENVASAKNGQ
jgi:putative ABC transport system ATP-binding protein